MKKKVKRNPKILDIRMIGDKVLEQVAEPVTEFNQDLRDFIEDMLHTMYIKDGAGLAAPQVGVSKRIFVVDPMYFETKKKEPLVFINPEIVSREGVYTYQEGCLSLPGIYEDVKRANKVVVKAQNVNGEEFAVEAEEYFGVVLQHENDHLDGILFTERLSKLKLLPFKKKIRQIKSTTDSDGNNIRIYD